MNPYTAKDYTHSVKNAVDELTVTKPHGSDWLDIGMSVNKQFAGRITIRSREQVEQLHFLLGQVLEKP